MNFDSIPAKFHKYFYLLLLFSVLFGVLYVRRLWTLDSDGVSPFARKLPEWDYSNMWFGGRLALSGHVATIFDLQGYREFIASIAPRTGDSQEWSYPPSILLIAAPLATLPLLPSYLIWTFGAIGLLFGLLRYGAAPLSLSIAAILSPAMFMNVLLGQNGAVSAAFLCGGLLLLRRRPLLAGVLFGLLTFKPHLGLMIPICLLAGRQWSAIGAAVVTAVLLAVLTAVCFGLDSWSLFFSQTVPMMRNILEAPYPQPYQVSCVSIFMFLRSLGLALNGAWACQGISALAAGLLVWRAWRVERADNSARIALTIIATFVATPYAYIYDLVAYCVALTILLYLIMNNARINDLYTALSVTIIVFLWFWPELQNSAISYLYYQVSAVGILLAFGVAAAYSRWLEGPNKVGAGGVSAQPARC